MRGRILAALALLAAGTAVPAAVAQDGELHENVPDECAWPMYGHDPGHSFATPEDCSALTKTNAPALQVKWVFPTPDSISASPAVVDGVVYVGSWDGTFYALPADPPAGQAIEPLWTFTVTDTNDVGFGRIVSSAAVADIAGRRVVVFGGGSTLYVLDAATGTEVTSLCLDPRAETDPPTRCIESDADIEIESSPAVLPGVGLGAARIVVGTDVHNARNVGRTGVVALDVAVADDGGWSLVPAWKFDPEARETYRPGTHGDILTVGSGTGLGCSSVWSSPAVDVTGDLVFFGTGSCRTTGVGEESVYAVGLDDGGLVWSHAAPRPDGRRYDDDFGASSNLLPGGLIGIGGKDGWYYRFRRSPGPGEPALVGSTHAGQAGHASQGFAIGGMIGSAATGEVAGEPAVFATTAIGTPVGEPYDTPEFGPDATLADDPGRMLSLHAISAVDGRVLWRAPLARPSYGSASYVNGVVLFASTFDFSAKAFDADTGLLLWESPLPGPPSSTPVALGDSVYIGVGTRTTDAEYKLTDGNTISPLSPLSGVVAFQLVTSSAGLPDS